MMKSTLGVTFNNFTILACVLNLHTFYQLWLDNCGCMFDYSHSGSGKLAELDNPLTVCIILSILHLLPFIGLSMLGCCVPHVLILVGY